MVREVVHVQVGECGVQNGNAFWHTISAEHKLAKDGKFTGNKDDAEDARRLDNIDVYFEETGDLRFAPRAALVNLEPGSVDVIKASPIGTIFKPNNFVFGASAGAGNTWATGHYSAGGELIDEVLDVIRKEVESCDCPQGIQITNSLGGGTGSGLGTLLLIKIGDNYPDRITTPCSVYPSPKVSDVVVEPYNATLSIHQLLENGNEAFVIDNESLYNISHNILKQQQPKYGGLNWVFSLVTGGITGSLRFSGKLNGYLRKMGVNLVPFPRLHFFTIDHAPLLAPADITHVKVTVPETTDQTLSSRNFLTNVKCGYRGNLAREQVDDEIVKVQQKMSDDFVTWIANNIESSQRARKRERDRNRDGRRPDRKHRRYRDDSDETDHSDGSEKGGNEKGGSRGKRSNNRDKRYRRDTGRSIRADNSCGGGSRDGDRDRGNSGDTRRSDRDSRRRNDRDRHSSNKNRESTEHFGRNRDEYVNARSRTDRYRDRNRGRDRERSGRPSTGNVENDRSRSRDDRNSKSHMHNDAVTTTTRRRGRTDATDERNHEHERRQDTCGRSLDSHQQSQQSQQHGSNASRYGGQTQHTRLSGDTDSNGDRTLKATAHRLENVSSQLPTAPEHTMKTGYGADPVEICIGGCKMELMVEITKYDVEFDPKIPEDEDARTRRDEIFKQIGKYLRNIYGEYFTDNTRIFATEHVEEDKQFPFEGGKGTVTLKNGQLLQIRELGSQYKSQINGIIAQQLYRKVKSIKLAQILYDFQNYTRNQFGTCDSVLKDITVADVLDNIWKGTIQRFWDLSKHEQFNIYTNGAIGELEGKTCLCHVDCKLYRIDDIDFNLNKDSPSNEPDANGLTISQYYSLHYDINLKNNRNGMVICKTKRGDRNGESQRITITIPSELLRLTSYDAKLHANAKKRNVTTDVSNATKATAIKQDNGWKKILHKLCEITENRTEMKKMKESVTVTTQSSEMNGEVKGTIDAKILESKESSSSMDLGGMNDSMPTVGDKWGIVYHEENNSSEEADKLIESIVDYAKAGGYEAINDPKRFPLQLSNSDPKFWDREFARHIGDLLSEYKELKALIVILPRAKSRVVSKICSAVRQSCGVDKGILLQCVKAQICARRTVILGVLKQILVKLGSEPRETKFNYHTIKQDLST